MELSDPLTNVKGVGPALAGLLARLGLYTVEDIIFYYPRAYDDYSVVTPVAQLKPGAVTIQAHIVSAKGRYVRRGMHVTEAVAADDSGSVRLVWFNQPYRESALKRSADYFISGIFELSHQRFAIQNPAVELVSDFPLNTARIVPRYRETKGLKSRQIRQIVEQLLPVIQGLGETLPAWLVEKYRLMPYAEAVEQMHFPSSAEQLTAAKHRLGFEEVFALILAGLMNRLDYEGEQAPAVPFDENVARSFVKALPFDLTPDQRRVVWQIYQDMQATNPMNRLVEGDVGSGKTVVAAMAGLMVLHNGHQAALMAPTELLARQHAETLRQLLEPSGYGDQVGLLVGSLSARQKETARQRIADEHIRFMVGTNALIQESVDMHALELVVIDEQHRFGVDQRKALQLKAGHMPHVLSMTATPIPRSLALTLYGELDISILAHKPPGRQPTTTKLVPPSDRPALYKEIDAELAAGRQMFVVCPLITDSEMSDAASAESVYERFRSREFKHHRVGLLHGRLKAGEKNEIMDAFVRHELDILVSTTVIEVGVDVPNASIMMIEAAERFGLAQIHQLRGRVGRGGHPGYCYLMLSDTSEPSRRLRALERSQDGFKLAELDLELRGPGAIYGTLQHGQLDLRIASLADTRLLAEARQAANVFLVSGDDLVQYSRLAATVNRLRAVTNLN
ncbi:MAG TPA: ATP-dependent DNA helicase RecG [Candidatus Saccharimonadales bacterium]|nr:ATP-dependent DNA helicase RecG [Candidatus Saccharimonadales bacterium]